jgi:hypothetical protein
MQKIFSKQLMIYNLSLTFKKSYNQIKYLFAVCFSFISINGFAQYDTTKDMPAGPLPLPINLVTDVLNDSEQVGYCLGAAGGTGCTANDFTITAIRTINVDDGCSAPDDYMQVDLAVTFQKQQPTRYNLGTWFYRGPDATTTTSFNTQTAITGDFCARVALGAGLEIDGGPDLTAIEDTDLCIDADGPKGLIEEQIVENVVLPCRDIFSIDPITGVVSGTLAAPQPDGVVDISACTSWRNSAGLDAGGANQCVDAKYVDTTNVPGIPTTYEILPGTSSKCNCGEFDGGPIIEGIPDITITKSCTPVELAPGETTQCTITIVNSGLGQLDGASGINEAGFFYQDDYPEAGGASVANIVITSDVATPPDPIFDGTAVDGFMKDSDADDTTNKSLNIYPGIILAGDTVTVVYDFITAGTIGVSEPESTVTNTVCEAHYNDNSTPVLSDDEVTAYTDPLIAGDKCDQVLVTTPVGIGSFSVKPSSIGQGYDFTWTTSTETGNLGFNIYTVLGRTKFKMNDELIASKVVDSMGLIEYSFYINSRFNGIAQNFIIEDVDRLGRKHSNGIYKLGRQYGVLEDESMQKDTDWFTINQEFDKTVMLKNKNLSGVLNKQMRGVKGSQLKDGQQDINVLMNIVETGIYKVSYQDLSQLGVDLTNLKSDSISVTLNGQFIPLDMHVDFKTRQFTQDSYFLFYAKQAESSLYTEENVYTLNLNAEQASPEMSVVSSAPQGNTFASSYDKTVKINRNQAYAVASPVANDPWYDTRMLAVRSPSTSYINLNTKNKVTGNAELSLVYWGGVDFDDDDLDHAIDFKINGVELGSDIFDGITLRNKSYTVSTDLLQDSNELELILPAQTVNKIDLINLESVSLTYPSRFVASHDQLSFKHEKANFNVEKLVNSDVDVFAIQGDDVVKLNNYKSLQQINYTYNIQFSGIKGEAEYIVIAKSEIATPLLRMSQAKDVSIAATEHLIIAHGNFIGNDLKAYAQATREDYRIVDVADIYHLYSDNRPDGESIKSFITDVANNGDLKSVMLVGGDSYDYMNYTGLGSISFVPTIYRATDELVKFSAVDALFGDTNNDSIPEVAVGRLPVRTLNELKTILTKSQLYSSQKGELSAVLAADDSESLSAYQFASSSNQLVNQFTDDNWTISTAYLDEKSLEDSRQDIMDAMNSGVRLAVYTGHSSSKKWSFEGLFRNTDIDSLINVNNPFGVIQWGCWNTYFVDPKEDSLGHEFMLSGKKGAAFVLGASTLTNATQEDYFANIFNGYILLNGESIGSAMIKAKQEFAANRNLSHKDILWGITILGDPLIQIK